MIQPLFDMLAKSLTKEVSNDKKKTVYCDENDYLIIIKEGTVCIAYGNGKYFPIRKENIKEINMSVEELVKAVESVEKNYKGLSKEDAFPIEFVKWIAVKSNIEKEFKEKVKGSNISTSLKNKLYEM
jgi:hypothetical protein